MGQNLGLIIDIEKKLDGGFLVKLKGRIDSDTYNSFDQKVKPILIPSTRLVILDMEKVNYVSSAGLAVIFQIKKGVEGNGGSLIISGLQPQVKKVMEIVKALPPENVFQSRQELDQYLDVIQKKEIKRARGET